MLKEHSKLKRRLEEVQNPEFLIDLKKALKETDDEIKKNEKLSRDLHND